MIKKKLFNRKVKAPSALKPLAKSFIKRLKPGSVVLLKGELGAGKTTFVKAICNELSIDPNEVKSPSYTLINEYENLSLSENCEIKTIYHIDLYRLPDSSELDGLGLSDYIENDNSSSIVLIEWADCALEYLYRTSKFLYLVDIAIEESSRNFLIYSLT